MKNTFYLSLLSLLFFSSSYSGEIHKAVIDGDVNKVENLVFFSKSPIDLPDQHGNTPLHLACMYLQYDVFKYLTSKNIDLNTKNNRGDTPLHFLAIASKDKNKAELATFFVSLLLKKSSIEVNIENHKGYTPLDIAEDIGATEMVDLLIEAGANS